MYELLPEVERRFRGIGEGWARFTYGCSTGGWVSLAVQVFYPVRQGVHFRLLSALLAGRPHSVRHVKLKMAICLAG